MKSWLSRTDSLPFKGRSFRSTGIDLVMKFQFWKGMDAEAWRFLLKKNEISYFDMFNSIIGYKSVTYKTCSVTRVTRLASQTQLSIVLHRKVLGCGVFHVIVGDCNCRARRWKRFLVSPRNLLWINLVTLLMKDLRLVCYGEQASGSGFEGSEQNRNSFVWIGTLKSSE